MDRAPPHLNVHQAVARRARTCSLPQVLDLAKTADGGSALDLLLQPPAKKVKVGAVTSAADALAY
eukprot:361176-Chlamydomonas_euryale.AAC.8